MPLFRFARRGANWEEDLPIEELQKREFKSKHGGPDLRPSVYELDGQTGPLLRAYAEHAHHIDPPTRALAIESSVKDRAVQTTPGKLAFAFVRDQHREILLNDEADLLALISELVAKGGEGRIPIPKQDVIAYARQRIEEHDPEWTAAAAAPDARSWLIKLRKP
ncbi:hypothetical protein [Chondromyces crocatus]|uniref:Uncharacterized protein n=1 Tax=Chondromyces crocatus TaxID=52 RepID=A0A0K1ETX0_CHOCO|nr:hypothetical protein [Chondromyces crocatus]AKT44063.1 uncharacterized protein CMC5_083010 [Chondromyces crocatus]